MQLVIQNRIYDLIEINCPEYIIQEQFPNLDFEFYQQPNTWLQTFKEFKYKAIIINFKYYAPKLRENGY